MLERGESNSVREKVSGEGRKVTSVPRRSAASPTAASGASATPLVKLIAYSVPSLKILSLRETERALTTETPTPCRPPETL